MLPRYSAIIATTVMNIQMHSNACTQGWSLTLDAVLEDARASRRLAVVVFTGSDWSARSLRLDQQVLMNPEFSDLFSKHFALVNLDFPQRNRLELSVMKTNARIATKYEITKWPTLLALRPDGTEFARLEYDEESVSAVTALITDWQSRFAQEQAVAAQP